MKCSCLGWIKYPVYFIAFISTLWTSFSLPFSLLVFINPILCPVSHFLSSFSSYTHHWPEVYLHCPSSSSSFSSSSSPLPSPPPLGDLALATSTLLAHVVQQELPSPHLLLHHRHALFEFQVRVQTEPMLSSLVHVLKSTIDMNRQTVRALIQLHVTSTAVVDRITFLFQSLLSSSSSGSSNHHNEKEEGGFIGHSHSFRTTTSQGPIPFIHLSTSQLESKYHHVLTMIDQEIQQWHHVLLTTQHQLSLLENQMGWVMTEVIHAQQEIQLNLDEQKGGWLVYHWNQFRGGPSWTQYLKLQRQQSLLSSTHLHHQSRQVSELLLLLDHFEGTLEQFKKKTTSLNFIHPSTSLFNNPDHDPKGTSSTLTSSQLHLFEIQNAIHRLLQAKQKALDMWKDPYFQILDPLPPASTSTHALVNEDKGPASFKEKEVIDH
ncbi:hypothetical protein HMI54_015621 [Coelomomyces lativittatus]|nr:hypothetical protein HMI54_015621 [Coelomomyces lativittatus]